MPEETANARQTKRDIALNLWEAGESAAAIAERVGWTRRGSVTRLVFDAREAGDPRAVRRSAERKRLWT